MTRTEYLHQLEELLFSLTEQEKQDVLDYFVEYFEERDNDAQSIEDLGSPEEAAREILLNLQIEQDNHFENRKEKMTDDIRQHFDKETFKTHFKEEFQKNFTENFKETFLSHFLKNFTFTSSNRKSIEKGPIVLEPFNKLKVDVEDSNLTILSTNQETPFLTYKLFEDAPETQLQFTLENGLLTLSDIDTDIVQVTLFIPENLVIEQMEVRAEDSNLKLNGLTINDSKIVAEDTNVTVHHSSFNKASIEMNDCNWTIKDTTLSAASIELADCNLTISQCQFFNLVEFDLQDCNLVLKDIKLEDLNLDIEIEDGFVNLPTSLQPILQRREDEVSLTQTKEAAPGTLKISGEDCILTIR